MCPSAIPSPSSSFHLRRIRYESRLPLHVKDVILACWVDLKNGFRIYKGTHNDSGSSKRPFLLLLITSKNLQLTVSGDRQRTRRWGLECLDWGYGERQSTARYSSRSVWAWRCPLPPHCYFHGNQRPFRLVYILLHHGKPASTCIGCLSSRGRRSYMS